MRLIDRAQLIREENGSSESASPPAADGTETPSAAPEESPVCREEYIAALAAMYDLDPESNEICAAAGELNEDGRYQEAAALIGAARAAALARIQSEATAATTPPSSVQLCQTDLEDAESHLALGFGAIAEAWTDFQNDVLKPAFPLLLTSAATTLGLAVLARLLMTVPFLRDRKTMKEDRVAMGTLGTLGIVFAPAAALISIVQVCGRDDFLGCDSGFVHSWEAVLAGVFWLVVGVASAFALAYAIGSRLRLVLHGRGAFGDDAEAGTPWPFLSRLRDIGGTPARGVEVPVGTDVTSLASAIAELPQSKVLQYIERVWNLLVNASPWKATIRDEGDKGRGVSVTLERNGHVVASEVIRLSVITDLIDRNDLNEELKTELLASLAAGFSLSVLRERYPSELNPGLYGATEWKSIGLHYVASTLFGFRERAEAIVLLRSAVEADRDNRLATTSLWNFTYRESTSVDSLRAYAQWLTLQIEPSDRERNDELRLRQLMTHSAVLRNIHALGQKTDDIPTLVDLACDLLGPDVQEEAVKAIHDRWRQIAANDTSLLSRERARLPMVNQWLEDAKRSGDARVAYAVACTWAVQWKNAQQPEKEELRKKALDRLRIALVNPELEAWARHDPELKPLLQAYGADLFRTPTVLIEAREYPRRRIRPLSGSRRAAALSSDEQRLLKLVTNGTDLNGYGFTALRLLASRKAANTAWLRANRHTPRGQQIFDDVFFALRNEYGFPGTRKAFVAWIDELSRRPSSDVDESDAQPQEGIATPRRR
jgi:hypothetical protein